MKPIEKLVFSCATAVEAVREGHARQEPGHRHRDGDPRLRVADRARSRGTGRARTFVPADAVISRFLETSNRRVALDLMRQLGTSVISTELGLFDFDADVRNRRVPGDQQLAGEVGSSALWGGAAPSPSPRSATCGSP